MSNREAIEKIESKLASGELTPDYYVRQAIVTRYAENHGGLYQFFKFWLQIGRQEWTDDL